jgi:hypothetical protein
MRVLIILAVALIPAVAQSPVVQLINATRPASRDFKIGDRFEVVITAATDLPISVRTTMRGRTDWGPVIGRTDMSGRWSTTGQYEKGDFGDWSEVWTVGGRVAIPAVHFSVGAPCLTGGQRFQMQIGLYSALACETAEGRQTFGTPSDTDPMRTPDGRLIPGRMRSNLTAEQYHMEIMRNLISNGKSGRGTRQLGDEAAALITKMIGPNALTEDETRNALSIIRAAFEKPDRIPQAAKDPSRTLSLLRNLVDWTDQESLKQQIAETMAYVQAR